MTERGVPALVADRVSASEALQVGLPVRGHHVLHMDDHHPVRSRHSPLLEVDRHSGRCPARSLAGRSAAPRGGEAV